MIRSKIDQIAVDAGCYYDPEAAERVLSFFSEFLIHSKGRWSGQPFSLLPWQVEDVVKPLYGWKRADGTRRYRRAYIEIPKKNGKSTMCSGLAIYHLIADGEQGAEVYSAAADREQASIVYREAAEMVKASPLLSSHVERVDSRKRLVFPRTHSFYAALSAEVSTKEGLNISALIFDELHAQRTRALWEALEYGGVSRDQPLAIAITTSGYDRHSICWEQHLFAEQVLDGTIEDWSFFPYIRAAQDDDDWTDEKVWEKANPSLDVIINRDEMREACKAAQASPSKENAFKRYRLDIWTEQDMRWLSLQAWDACDMELPDLAGLPCTAGLDLSSNKDLSALVLGFQLDDGLFALLPHFWLPADNLRQRVNRDHVPYDQWRKAGLLTLTPGNVIDYDFIRKYINETNEKYQITGIAIDRWNATHISTQLMHDGFDVIGFGQGMASMTAPTKELETLVVGGKLVHGGNPVLRWMAGNIAVETDSAANLKPCKKKSVERIDGIVAAIMALGISMKAKKVTESVYKSRGIIVV